MYYYYEAGNAESARHAYCARRKTRKPPAATPAEAAAKEQAGITGDIGRGWPYFKNMPRRPVRGEDV